MAILLSATGRHFGGMGVAGGVDSPQPPPPLGTVGSVPGGNEGGHAGTGQGKGQSRRDKQVPYFF